MITRRSLFSVAAASRLLRSQPGPLQFGFSLYGMKTLPWRDGLRHVARIGYKATELSLRTGWNTEPKLLTKPDRAELRARMSDLGLALPSVMENLALARPGGTEAANLDRLKAAAEICFECSPSHPALIETTVGGRPGTWEDLKNGMAGELAQWAKTLAELKVILAIKCHSKTAMSRPEFALWLTDQVKSPWVKVVYDYSHFLANSLDLRATMQQLIPRAVFVHIKDTEGRAPNHRFLLPGDGDIDYKGVYVPALKAMGYRGPVVVEVSVDVFDRPGYDPVKAAEQVWAKLSAAFA